MAIPKPGLSAKDQGHRAAKQLTPERADPLGAANAAVGLQGHGQGAVNMGVYKALYFSLVSLQIPKGGGRYFETPPNHTPFRWNWL